MPDHGLDDVPDLSVASCLSHCQFYGSRYAVLRNGFRCRCGSDGADYDLYGKVPESECDEQCTGGETQYCGGYARNSVFDLWGKKTCFNILPSIHQVQISNEMILRGRA